MGNQNLNDGRLASELPTHECMKVQLGLYGAERAVTSRRANEYDATVKSRSFPVS